MRQSLYSLLMETGLVQFGLFGEEEALYKVHPQLLPSYPDVLTVFASQAKAYLPANIDRLLCLPDSLPFGVALSLETQIPLVYSLGTKAAGVHDLIGAYDVGHPACLLLNTWPDDATVQGVIHKAEAVGLQIEAVMVLFSLNLLEFSHPVHVMVDVSMMLQSRAEEGVLPAQLAQTIIKNG
jgi:hypothetical protein